MTPAPKGHGIPACCPCNRHTTCVECCAAFEKGSEAREKVLKELLDFIDNADNQFDKYTVHKLVDWVVSKGVIPDAR